MFHKPPNNVLVQLRPNLELLNHKKRRTLNRSIYTDMYIYNYSIHIYYIVWNHHHGSQNKDVLVPCTSLRCLPSRSCRQPHIIELHEGLLSGILQTYSVQGYSNFPNPLTFQQFSWMHSAHHLRPFGFQTFRM